MQLITDTKTLAETCARLARHPFVTVDTEFLRESTYYPKLCVLQMASVEEAVVVDALAPDIGLGPLFELLADPRVVKVFHAARQDIEICWHAAQMGNIHDRSLPVVPRPCSRTCDAGALPDGSRRQQAHIGGIANLRADT